MKLEDYTPEQREKALACATREELLELLASEGVELSDEELAHIAGGSIINWDDPLSLGGKLRV